MTYQNDLKYIEKEKIISGSTTVVICNTTPPCGKTHMNMLRKESYLRHFTFTGQCLIRVNCEIRGDGFTGGLFDMSNLRTVSVYFKRGLGVGLIPTKTSYLN